MLNHFSLLILYFFFRLDQISKPRANRTQTSRKPHANHSQSAQIYQADISCSFFPRMLCAFYAWLCTFVQHTKHAQLCTTTHNHVQTAHKCAKPRTTVRTDREQTAHTTHNCVQPPTKCAQSGHFD